MKTTTIRKAFRFLDKAILDTAKRYPFGVNPAQLADKLGLPQSLVAGACWGLCYRHAGLYGHNTAKTGLEEPVFQLFKFVKTHPIRSRPLNEVEDNFDNDRSDMEAFRKEMGSGLISRTKLKRIMEKHGISVRQIQSAIESGEIQRKEINGERFYRLAKNEDYSW